MAILQQLQSCVVHSRICWLPVQHVGIPGGCQVHPEEPGQEELDDRGVEEDELGHPELPPLRRDRGGVRVLGWSAPVSVAPGLDEGEPGLQDQSEAGVVRPLGEDEPAGGDVNTALWLPLTKLT